MVIISYVIFTRNAWKLDKILDYNDIMQPVYSNVFLHGNFLQGYVNVTKK